MQGAIARGAAVRISVRVSGDGCESTCWFQTFPDPVVVRGSLNKIQLRDQRRELRTALNSVRDAVGPSLELDDWESISEAVHQLHAKGRELASALFPRSTGAGTVNWLKFVQDHFVKACSGWENAPQTLPIVEVEAQLGDVVPFELLPIFDLRHPSKIDDGETLKAVMRQFLGFSALVRHVAPRTVLTQKLLLINDAQENSARLPVKFFQNGKLFKDIENEEALFFQVNEEFVELDGPWPDAPITKDEVYRTVARHVWHNSRNFKNEDMVVSTQIQHFTCHCNAESGENNEVRHLITLAHGEDDYSMGINQFKSEFVALADELRRANDWPLPLIFLNACGSSMIDPGATDSLPGFFLQEGYRGFIGTETHVSLAFATAFSHCFYGHLLRGHSLGYAMQLTRWHLLKEHNNPLGLFYTLYANPDIRVSRPVEKLVLLSEVKLSDKGLFQQVATHQLQ